MSKWMIFRRSRDGWMENTIHIYGIKPNQARQGRIRSTTAFHEEAVMRTLKVLGLALVGTFALAKLGFADGDHQAKWEEMKKQHEECLKKAGFDQATIDA